MGDLGYEDGNNEVEEDLPLNVKVSLYMWFCTKSQVECIALFGEILKVDHGKIHLDL